MGRLISCTVDFIRLVGILMLWAMYPHEKLVAARDPRFESGDTGFGTRDFDLIPVLLNLSPNVEVNVQIIERPAPSPAPAPVPAPAPAPAHKSRKSPLRHSHQSSPNHGKKQKSDNGRKMDSAKKVGLLFGVVAGLLQVAVAVFLLVKRKQMMRLVKKYDGTQVDLHNVQSGDSQGHWNGLHA